MMPECKECGTEVPMEDLDKGKCEDCYLWEGRL
jgi:predicted ATP-dependent serine protease